MREFCGLLSKEVKNFFEEVGEKSFRALQLFDWVYQKGVMDYEKMLNLPQSLRVTLRDTVKLGLLQLEKVERSEDQETKKFLWKLADSRFVESVLILSGERRDGPVCLLRWAARRGVRFAHLEKRGSFETSLRERLWSRS